MKKILLFIAIFCLIPFTVSATDRADWAKGTLSSAILNAYGNGDTFTVTLDTNANDFPTSNFYVLVFDAACANPSVCATREYLLISGRSSTTFTIDARNQRGTTHSDDWDVGAKIQQVVSAYDFDEKADVAYEATVDAMQYPNISDYSDNQLLTATDMKKGIVTNLGAGAGKTFTLPACTTTKYTVTTFIEAAFTVALQPDGTDQIMILTNAGGDSLTSDAVIGSYLTLICLQSGKWYPFGQEGTWTDTD